MHHATEGPSAIRRATAAWRTCDHDRHRHFRSRSGARPTCAQQRPLVHNITNYVAMTVAANVLLALGASPAMVHAARGSRGFRRDLECAGDQYRHAVAALGRGHEACRRQGGRRSASPGCSIRSAAARRPTARAVAAELAALKPTVIRGNASEIMSLAGAAGAGGRGVDFDRRLRRGPRGGAGARQRHRRHRRRHRRDRLRHRRRRHRRRRRRRCADAAVDGARLRAHRLPSPPSPPCGRRSRRRSPPLPSTPRPAPKPPAAAAAPAICRPSSATRSMA